jgi:3-isopropylmalate/(R)-2-methylmalate dehydratase small subunit
LVLTLNPDELAKHAMEGLDPNFYEKAKGGVVLVARKNFGCGSSREEAPWALKHAGVKCLLAESFARIFYRNATNIGLPVLECPGVSEKVEEGDDLAVDLKVGRVENRSKYTVLQATKLPNFILEILDDGGLIEHLKRKVKQK